MLLTFNYYFLLAFLLIDSLRTSICVCKYLYMLSATFDDQSGPGQWPCLFPLPHQVQGHFPWPWNFIYNPWKLLYLSGWSWFQFSIQAQLGLFHPYFVCKSSFRVISMIKMVILDRSKPILLIFEEKKKKMYIARLLFIKTEIWHVYNSF